MDIGLYQEYSRIFLGLTLDGFQRIIKSTRVQNLTCKEVESLIAESFYYLLDKHDCDLNRKFHSNLALCNKKSDQSYKDWLKEFAGVGSVNTKEVIPDLTLDCNMNALVLKPKPRIAKKEIIIVKPKPVITLKTKPTKEVKPKPKVVSNDIIKKKSKGKQHNVFEKPVEIYVQPSDAMQKFIWVSCGHDKPTNPSIDKPMPIVLIKETVNKYICDKNLQDLVQRSIIHLDVVLQELFQDQLKGKTDITYSELREYLKPHYKRPA